MPLQVPNLDDRRWAKLVEDARSLIPRLAPRWTDHNVHDPGITFIELLAWLAEMQIYQLNRVGARHREAFARLADVQRRPRSPARVEVVAEGELRTSVQLEAGTQLSPLEADELVFETTERVTLTRSKLQKVIVDDGSGPVDQGQANQTLGFTFLAFGARAGAGATLTLGFDRFYEAQEPELRLTADVFTDDLLAACGPERPIASDAGEEAGVRPVDLAWEYLAAGGRWLPLDLRRDGTVGFSRSGAVMLAVPTAAAVERGQVWIRCRIARGRYDIEPRLHHIGINWLPCVQRETVQNEPLGRGNGDPDQSFMLAKGPILTLAAADDRAVPPSRRAPADAAVRIQVDGEEWTYVGSFDDADRASKRFLFDPESRVVLFGNGLNGQVPAPGREIRALWYQTSAGRAGNVARDLTWRFRNRVVPGVSLTNPRAATGGTDPESLDEMELRARAVLARPDRAVTLEDLEGLALGTPHAYVARAHAIAHCPRREQITVVVMPKQRPGRTGSPMRPSPAFLAAVRRHLESKRLLCDELRVIAPAYIEVTVSARLRLAKGAGAAPAIERARRALGRFLTGEDRDAIESAPPSPCPTRWLFGRSVFPSEVYAVLDGVRGVDSVSGLVLSAWREGLPVTPDATGAVRLPPIGLVFPGAQELTVEGQARPTP